MKHLFFLIAVALFFGCSDGEFNSSEVVNGSGTGGSLARFAIAGNMLYIVDNTTLRTFDVSNAADPKPVGQTQIGVGIETIFPYQGNLFIGANDAMYIYDLQNPANPRQLSRYDHFVGCDPVVAKGNYAFVTLRITGCRPVGQNVLDVIDISNRSNPRVVATFPMDGPYGLGITNNNTLFVCEGLNGMRVFDATEPLALRQISYLTNIKAFDVIALPFSLLVIGQDGLRQYNYADPTQLELLSFLPVEN